MESWAETGLLPLTDQEIVDVFSAEPFDFEPGEAYRYNNSGYLLLGVILAELSGVPYRELVETEVFAPLGMTGSRYCDERRIIPNRAEGYEPTPDGLVNDAPIWMAHPGAAGALCSTVLDLLRWADGLRDGEYVSEGSYAAMSTSSTLNDGSGTGYGFGLMVGGVDGHPRIWHNGAINGFTTVLAYLPEIDADVVVLSNTSGAHANAMAGTIQRWLLGIEVALDLELAPEVLARYEGTYGRDPDMQMIVSLRADGLYAQTTGQDAVRLRAQGEHRFIPTFPESASLTFHLEDGGVVGMTLVWGRGTVRVPKIR
jgi:CubicO group peptidase (beta-lactamase class C family)